MPTIIIADAVHSVTLTNGILRIRLGMVAGDNEVQESGILLMPANQAGPIINHLTNSLKEISEKIQEQQTTNLAEEAVAALEASNAEEEADKADDSE